MALFLVLLDAVGVCSLIAFGMLQPGARSCDGLSGKTRRELISLRVWVVSTNCVTS